MLEIDFVFFGDGGEINNSFIPRGAVRIALFDGRLMEAEVG